MLCELVTKMKVFLLRIYQVLFCRARFYPVHRFLLGLGLRGIGVLNYEDDLVSGEEDFLKRLSRKPGQLTVLDVGANVGNYSKKVLKYFSDVRIHAFEPHPKNYEILMGAINSPSFHGHNLAVGAKAGELVYCSLVSHES